MQLGVEARVSVSVSVSVHRSMRAQAWCRAQPIPKVERKERRVWPRPCRTFVLRLSGRHLESGISDSFQVEWRPSGCEFPGVFLLSALPGEGCLLAMRHMPHRICGADTGTHGALHPLDARGTWHGQVASLRGFGMTIFYFMMGIYVHLHVDFFRENFGYSVLVTGLNVLVTPLIVWLMGYICGLKCRTTIHTRCLACLCVCVCVCVCVRGSAAPQSTQGTCLAPQARRARTDTTEGTRARKRVRE